MRRRGVSQEQLRAKAEAAAASVPGPPAINVHRVSLQLRLAPRAQATLTLAADEGRALKRGYIGVEHVLLAMLRWGDGRGFEELPELGVTLDRARAALREFLDGMAAMGYDRNGDVVGYTAPTAAPGERRHLDRRLGAEHGTSRRRGGTLSHLSQQRV